MIWTATYTGLISEQQIDYMLADRYAPERLSRQIDDPMHAWRLAYWEHDLVGFAHGCLETGRCKLDKLYIHADYQRRGIGRALLADVKIFARTHAVTSLYLQVNRGNVAAIAAYQQYGFTISNAQVFDIGGGFVMDDYVMEARI
ncbi:MAG: GNAT family N-acetyltransferase [Thiobacillus sp.]